MSTPTSRTTETGSGAVESDRRPSRWRRWRIAGAVAGMAALAGITIAATSLFGGGPSSGGAVTGNAYPTAIARVRLGSLSAQVTGLGTLGYSAQQDGSPYVVVDQADGTITALPSVGQVIRQGQMLYSVDNNPVILLNGTTPASRTLSVGSTGPDVAELNADLVSMGYAASSALSPSSDYFGPTTAAAVAQLQGVFGDAATGSLSLGQAVFLPGPLRVTQLNANLGGNVGSGATVLQATSTSRQVQVNIDATEQSSLSAGDPVLITLPNYQDTPGVVTSIGTVANGSNTSSPTIPVDIALKHPQDAGSLDQAPVRVQITTTGVTNALIVPVTALLPRAGGGYAVETADGSGLHHLVPVALGLFDDADGLVQVFSRHLTAGQQIVVPAA